MVKEELAVASEHLLWKSDSEWTLLGLGTLFSSPDSLILFFSLPIPFSYWPIPPVIFHMNSFSVSTKTHKATPSTSRYLSIYRLYPVPLAF